jgi:hypothetical protein
MFVAPVAASSAIHALAELAKEQHEKTRTMQIGFDGRYILRGNRNCLACINFQHAFRFRRDPRTRLFRIAHPRQTETSMEQPKWAGLRGGLGGFYTRFRHERGALVVVTVENRPLHSKCPAQATMSTMAILTTIEKHRRTWRPVRRLSLWSARSGSLPWCRPSLGGQRRETVCSARAILR